jgi:hypothetical protein
VKSPVLLYEDKPKYDRWLIILAFGIPAVFLVASLAFINIDVDVTWFILGDTAFVALLLWAVIPRGYEIYADRLKIRLGSPFAMNVPLESIKSADKASSYYAMAYWGMRLATSTSNVVEIKRNRGMNVIISPSNPDIFLQRLDEACKSSISL